MKFTPWKAIKPLRHKWLPGVEELAIETLLINGSKKSKQEGGRVYYFGFRSQLGLSIGLLKNKNERKKWTKKNSSIKWKSFLPELTNITLEYICHISSKSNTNSNKIKSEKDN